MTPEWISAQLALKYVETSFDEYAAKAAILERARAGAILAKATRLSVGGDEEADPRISCDFWETERGIEIVEDWAAGDFRRECELDDDTYALGVSFDFIGISELVAADYKARAMQSISVMANPDWISSRDLQGLMFKQRYPMRNGHEIVEPCKLGLLVGRAMRAEGKTSPPNNPRGYPRSWVAREWDIPVWFWMKHTEANSSAQDWGMGMAKGRGSSPIGTGMIELSGVHFHRDGLANLGLIDPTKNPARTEKAKRGRKPTYDWSAASAAIWGMIVRGDLIPKNQAMIERAFIRELANRDGEPSESTVRPYANVIWEEYSKA